MKMHRRTFLKHTTVAGAGISLAATGLIGTDSALRAATSSSTAAATVASPAAPTKAATPSAGAAGNPIGVSTYSFSRYNGERTSVLQCIDIAAEMGFEGVEILHNQMDDESNAALQGLKARAHALGMTLMGFSTHQGFLYPAPERRRENVDLTIRQLQLASAMGIPTMRINTGRWGTTASFNQLMEDEGYEPIPEGLTEEMGFTWVIDSLEQILPRPRSMASSWVWRTTGASVARPPVCCASLKPSIHPGCRSPSIPATSSRTASRNSR